MVKRQKFDYSVRQAIVKLHKEEHSIREISEKVKRSKSVVGKVVKSYNDTGKIVRAFKTGRPHKTSAREDRIMQRMSLKDRFKSCTEIKRVMNSTSCVNVSRQTVSRRLQEIGLFNRTPRKKPLDVKLWLLYSNTWNHLTICKKEPRFIQEWHLQNILTNHIYIYV